jgi:hypothetical protein
MKTKIHVPENHTSLRGIISLLHLLSVGAILLALSPNQASASPPGYTFSAVTSIGSAAPGGGAFVNDFEPTRLNNRGQLAFTAEPDQPGEEAVFLAGGGTIQQIMRFGQNAPGTASVFSTFELGNLGLNDPGDMALAFTLGSTLDFGPPVIGGVYRWSALTRSLSPVVVPGTQAAGVGTFAGADFIVGLNNQGLLTFSAYLGAPADPTKRGVFVQDKNGSISVVAMNGTFVAVVGTLDQAYGPIINGRGDVGFNGQTSPSFATEQGFVKRAATGKIELVPGPAGFNGTVITSMNDAGDILLAANLSPLVGNVYQFIGLGALYLQTGGSLLRVAGTGDAAPGGGSYTIITAVSIGEQAALNNRGEVVFEAATDAGDEAMYLYSKTTGTVRRVAGIGDELPGIGTIVSLEQGGVLICCPPPIPTGFPLSNAINNDRGQISFAATVQSGNTVNGVLLVATPTGAP